MTPDNRLLSHEFRFFADRQPAESFTLDEQKLLEPFFSNFNRPVYIICGLPALVTAALITRQSQTDFPPRRLFLAEFVQDRKRLQAWVEKQAPLDELSQCLQMERAESLFQRIYGEWGHDQPGKLIPLFFGFEGISQLATKALEDARLGFIPMERSTRFGQFGTDNLENAFARDPEIAQSPFANQYQQLMRELFEENAKLIGQVVARLKERYPQKTERWCRNHAFDLCRVLLPAATLTNMAAQINVLSLDRLVSRLATSELAEFQELGQMIVGEMERIFPSLAVRAKGAWQDSQRTYCLGRKAKLNSIRGEYVDRRLPEPIAPGVYLIEPDPQAEAKVIASILWELGDKRPMEEIMVAAARMDPCQKEKIFDAYIGPRTDLYHRAGRALEAAVFNFVSLIPFEIYRDLQRHQLPTQMRQDFGFDWGYTIEEELRELYPPAVEVILKMTEKARELYEKIRQILPEQAQYLVTFNALVRWNLQVNLRELVYIVERRSGPGAHLGYKRWAQMTYKVLKEFSPLLAKAFRFVDMTPVGDWVHFR